MKKENKILYLYSYLFLFCLFLRLPFFSELLIDGDETTFLILGKWLMEGNTPYERYSDLRPFHIFYIYGIFYKLANESIFFFRVYGALIIFFSSILVFKISLIFFEKKKSFLVSLFFIISGTSFYASAQSILSEHFFMLPFLFSIYLSLKEKKYFLNGCLMALAVAIRPNIIFVALFCTFYFYFKSNRRKFIEYGTGALIFILFTIIVIFYFNFLDLFILNAIYAPLEYAKNGNNIIVNTINLIKNSLLPFDKIFFFKFIFYFVSGCGFILSILSISKKKNDKLLFLIFTFALALFSLIISGHAPSAYLLHINFFTSFFFYFLISSFKIKYLKSVYLVTFLFLITNLYSPYKLFINSNILNAKLYRGTTYEIYEYLSKSKNLLKDKKIYVYTHMPLHLIFNTYPVSKYVHSPNIYKKHYLLNIDGTNKTKEADKIFFDEKLEFVIIEKDLKSFLNLTYNDNEKIEKIISNFEFLKQINNSLVYQKTYKF
jgi:hypothetical protein